MQTILAYTARHVGSDVGAAANTGAPMFGAQSLGFEIATQANGATWFWNAATDWNGGGLHFSNDYGFGLVDAKAAVRLAETWTEQSTSANRQSQTVDMDGPGATTTLVDNGLVTDFIAAGPTRMTNEHVVLDLDCETVRSGDFGAYLTSPSGTRLQLVADQQQSGFFTNPGYDGRWDFGTPAFMGESSTGSWTVSLVDNEGLRNIVIRDVSLEFYGSTYGINDLFVLTREFSDFAGRWPQHCLRGGRRRRYPQRRRRRRRVHDQPEHGNSHH